MQGEMNPHEVRLKCTLENSENSNFLFGWRGVLDLHKFGIDLSLDLHQVW